MHLQFPKEFKRLDDGDGDGDGDGERREGDPDVRYATRMLTEILAIYAAVVSTSSLTVSYFSYKSGNPRLSGKAELHNTDAPILHIWLYNKGRGAITVNKFELYGFEPGSKEESKTLESKDFPPLWWPFPRHQCGLRKRIEGHSDDEWFLPLPEMAIKWLNLPNLALLDLEVLLGNGNPLVLKVDISGIVLRDPLQLSGPKSNPEILPENP
jgi:hypothetical protein